MELSELTSIIFTLQDRVNFYWNLYIGGLIVIAGWVIANDKPLSRKLKLAIITAFVLFMVINWRSLVSSYLLLDAFTEEFKLNITTQTFRNQVLFPLIQKIHFRKGAWIATLIHLLLDGGTIYFIWTGISTAHTHPPQPADTDPSPTLREDVH